MTIKANLYCFQTTLRRHDTYLQLRGQGRPRQPWQNHHDHWKCWECRPGPVSHQHEVRHDHHFSTLSTISTSHPNISTILKFEDLENSKRVANAFKIEQSCRLEMLLCINNDQLYFGSILQIKVKAWSQLCYDMIKTSW